MFAKDGDILYPFNILIGFCLVCTIGTPVADMLAHSPHPPLIIDHVYERRDVTAEDEKGITLALKQRDRVRRIPLQMHVSDLWKLSWTSQHVSSTASTSPPANRPPSYSSNRILATHDCRGPRRTQPCRVPPVNLLPANCPAPMAFTRAPSGITPDCDSTRYFQS